MDNAIDIKALLARHSISPNKALGQNFLADRPAAEAIASAACANGLPVLEIGPGLGSLTRPLTERSERVTAVELDPKMVRALQSEFTDVPSLSIVEGDFLKFDLAGYAASCPKGYSVAANLPYYVTTPICMKLVSCPALPRQMALMMQREAAERFTAKPRERVYGPLSVLSQLYFDISTLLRLSPASYYPQPEVESCVLVLSRREGAAYSPALGRLLSAAFAMRRKTLVNNLRALGLPREEAEALLLARGISLSARAEELPPEAFEGLADVIA